MMAAIGGAPPWVNDYIGIPYVDGGRDRDGVDCYGLVRLVLAERRGILLPDYSEIAADDLARVARAFRAGLKLDIWRPVTEPREFDGVLMVHWGKDGRTFRRRRDHCGIVTTAGNVLHVEETTQAVSVPLDHYSVKGRIVGFVRHRDLDS